MFSRCQQTPAPEQVDKLLVFLKQKFKMVKMKEEIDGTMPLKKEHICFDKGHNMFLVVETDNGRSKFGYHKCSRCGYEEHWQYDYKIDF